MKVGLLGVAAVLASLAMASGESRASTIGPGDFGPQAQIETFDSQSIGNFGGALALNGVTYGFSAPGGYQIVQADPLSYLCISGRCLGNYVTGADFVITLGTPANLVGGYLGGNLVASQTDVDYYDINKVFLGASTPVPLTTINDTPAFFGFESVTDRIKYVQINPDAGQGVTTLDNFTFEITPLPAALPLFATGLGVMGLLGWRRKRKRQASHGALVGATPGVTAVPGPVAPAR